MWSGKEVKGTGVEGKGGEERKGSGRGHNEHSQQGKDKNVFPGRKESYDYIMKLSKFGRTSL